MGRIAMNSRRKILIAGWTFSFVAGLIGFPGILSRISAQSAQEPEVVCRFAGVSYSEATVIKGDRIPEQMCVRAANPPTMTRARDIMRSGFVQAKKPGSGAPRWLF